MESSIVRKSLLIGVVVVVAGGLGGWRWQLRNAGGPVGFASGNGRIEATEYDIATKRAGRIAKVLVVEGDMVESGQVLSQMDVQDLEAERRQAEALLRQALADKQQSLAIIGQREAEIAQAVAAVHQRKSQLELAKKEFARTESLLQRELIARQQYDEDETQMRTAEATLAQEEARQVMAEANLRAGRVQVKQRDAAIDAARAAIQRIATEIDDSRLKAPITGRVLYRLAEPGEVLGAGGKILILLDLTDVYMTIFLPTALVGQLKVGAEARIVLDALPQYVVPASISFVAPRSQFTPKEVETQSERDKLVFRVKVRIAPELLRKYIQRVRTGLTGVAYVQLEDNASWPEKLQVKLP